MDEDALLDQYFNPQPAGPPPQWGKAFGAQESDNNPNAKTSITGAVGPRQIQPETFAQYAKPGEVITNPADNEAVGNRILSDYYRRYNGDAARAAVAYFSGPGNVSPPGSPTPWIKDKSDPTGKSVSSYVSDISGRLGGSNDDALLHSYLVQPTLPGDISYGPGQPTRITVRPSVPTIEQWNKDRAAGIPVNASPPANSLQSVAQDTLSWLTNLPGNMGTDIAQAFRGAVGQATQGAGELARGQYFPTTPSTDPRTWGAGGIANTLLGGAAIPLSVLAGPTHELIANPVTQLTGNPEIGERAGMVANLAIPGGIGGAKAASAIIPSIRAQNALIEAVGDQNIPSVLARLERNPNLALADIAPGVQTRAMGIAQTEGPGQDILFSKFGERTKGSAEGDYAPYEALGPQSNVIQDREAIVHHARDVGDKLIQPAVENAKPIPLKPLLSSIDRLINSPEAIAGESPRIPLDPTQQRLLKLRKEITNGEMAPLNERVGLAVGPISDALKSGKLGPERSADFTEARRLLNSARRGFTSEDDLIGGLHSLAAKQKIVGPIDEALTMIKKGPTEYRGPDFLHGVQSRLREEAETLRNSSSGSERLMSKELFDARDKLVGAIDKASGGTYRPALSKYRDAMQVRDAFGKGIDIERQRAGEAGIEDSPDALREWAKAASPEELLAAKKGALWAVKRKIGMMRNAGVSGGEMPPPLSPFTRQKFEILFGKDNADALAQNLADRRAIAESNSLWFRNSKTARTQQGIEEMKPRDVEPLSHGARSGVGLPALLEVIGAGMNHPELNALGAAIFGHNVLRKGGQYVMRKSDIGRNTAFAKMASATGTERESVMSLLRSRAQSLSGQQKFSNALARIGSNIIPP